MVDQNGPMGNQGNKNLLQRAPSTLMAQGWTGTRERAIGLWLEYAKFVPRLLRESILHTPGCLKLVTDTEEDFINHPMTDDAFLGLAVLDISGFTRMTADASKSGPLGADALHKLLNAFFSKLMQQLEKYGGDVFKFAGDAIIVVFLPTKEEKESKDMKELVSARTVQCVYDLIKEYGCVTMSPSGEIIPQNSPAYEEQGPESPHQHGHQVIPSEPVLSWAPEMHVDNDPDDTIDSRVEDSLNRLWISFGVSKWLSRPVLARSHGSWIFPVWRETHSGKRNSAIRETLNEVWAKLKTIGSLKLSWRTKEAINRIIIGRKSNGSLITRGMTYIWSDLRDPLQAHVQKAPTVWIKGMITCGDISFYRFGGNSRKQTSQICEILMVDKYADGGPLHDVSQIDKVAKGGQTVISKTIQSYLGNKVIGRTLQGGAVCVREIGALYPNSEYIGAAAILQHEEEALKNLSMEKCIQSLNLLKSHVPRTVKSLESKAYYNCKDSRAAPEIFQCDANMLVSHRTCSIMFFRFVNLHSRHNKDIIQKVFSIVQSHLLASGGDLLQMRNDEKGIVLIAGHGLPRYFNHAKANIASLSVTCAIKIIYSLRSINIDAVAGVTSGRILFASVGSSERCEYTIYGDPINLAARLMMHASVTKSGQQIVCDQETQTMCSLSGNMRFVQLQDLHIKGFDSPRPVFTTGIYNGEDLTGHIKSGGSILKPVTPFERFLKCTNSIFIGKKNEIEVFLGHVRRLQEGIGSTICLEDIAAVGKTRLLKHVFFSAEYIETSQLDKIFITGNDNERENSNGLEMLLTKVYGQASKSAQEFDTKPLEILEHLFLKLLLVSPSKNMSKSFHNLLGAYMKIYMEEVGTVEVSKRLKTDEDCNDTLSRILVFLVHQYVDRYGPCAIILDSMENVHPCLWRFARHLHESRSNQILLVLSYRWAQVIFDQILEERNRLSKMNESEMDLIGLANNVGMSHYYQKRSLSSIQSQVARDLCVISSDPATVKMSVGEFSVKDVKDYVTALFPSIRVNDGVFQMLHDALGGHLFGIKYACIFLFLFHQKKWGNNKPSPGFLGVTMIYQIRTLTPMWSAAESRFDSLPSYFKYVAVRMSIIGNVVPEDILSELCQGLRKETVARCMSVLIYIKYIRHALDKNGKSYFVWHHPILPLSILDMLAPDFRKELRARLALVLEHYQYKNGFDFCNIAWNWRDSCRLSEGIHWRRSLRAIASYEDQICVDLDQNNFSQAQDSLTQAIAIAVSLLHQQNAGNDLRVVPSWRIATWEKCMAACEILKTGGDFQKASQHCVRALTLLGEHLPAGTNIPQDVALSTHGLSPEVSKTSFPSMRCDASTKKILKSLASLGNPRTVLEYEGPDSHEPIKEIEGMTTLFLPRKGKTVDDEMSMGSLAILEIMLYIFESSGPWDNQSLDFALKACTHAVTKSTSRKIASRLRSVHDRIVQLGEMTLEATCSIFDS